MISDKIVPAVQMSDVAPGELSAEEFQKRLYRWFEDRGLLSELRAHLRKQMIGALKDTSMGQVAFANKSVISPKTQALNLLVGEFLLRYDYHYSLSVFSTEVPLTNTIPEVPVPLNSSSSPEGSCRGWRFAEADVWDILETMGVARESETAGRIYRAYYEEGEQPLLACLIKISNRALGSTVDANFESLLASDTYEDWVRAVGELLRLSQINGQQVKNVLNSIVSIVEGERKRLSEECASLKAKVGQYESTQTRFEINDYQVKMRHHQNLLQERYHQLILREREVGQREYRLEEKEQQLAVREKLLQATLSEQKATSKDNELIAQLQTENKALQSVKEEQGRRIDELTEKSTILLRDLESAQTAVNILTSGGPGKQRPKEKSSTSSSTSDEGTTNNNNVRREARELLERLTRESEEMDRYYQQFKQRKGLFLDNNRQFTLKTGHFSDLALNKPSCSLKRGENVPCKDTDDSASSGLDHTFPLSMSEETSH